MTFEGLKDPFVIERLHRDSISPCDRDPYTLAIMKVIVRHCLV
jgi:hypothetical protein